MLGLALFEYAEALSPPWRYPRSLRSWVEPLKPQVSVPMIKTYILFRPVVALFSDNRLYEMFRGLVQSSHFCDFALQSDERPQGICESL